MIKIEIATDEELLKAIGEAYDEARYGGIGDEGGSEPLWTRSGAEMILSTLRELGFDVVRISGQQTVD